MSDVSEPRRRPLLWIVGILLVGFVGIQFVRPSLTNPPVTADIQAPDEVKQILRSHCYACHSNETQLPLPDRVVPAYWMVVHDVKEARTHLNFSEIGKAPAGQQRAILFEAVNQVQMGAMPLPAQSAPLPAADSAAADAQYTKWVGSGNELAKDVQPEPNGFAFLPDYKNWKAISSTDRVDNHTMRVILGNDVAVRAIAEHRINPWPDGSAFAKVAWLQQPDGKGLIHTGAFIQVEFMLKDGVKYASTAGWGWGRWRGTELKPYGKDADFVNECVSCHAPLKKNDFVYTMPIGGQQ